jgi:hypothetical protein
MVELAQGEFGDQCCAESGLDEGERGGELEALVSDGDACNPAGVGEPVEGGAGGATWWAGDPRTAEDVLVRSSGPGGGDDDAVLVAQEWLLDDPGGVSLRRISVELEDGDVETAGGEVGEGGWFAHFDDSGLQSGVRIREDGDSGCDESPDGGRERSDGHRADRAAAECRQGVFSVGECSRERFGVLGERLPCGGQADAAAASETGPVEQSDAGFRFEPGEVLADRGRCEVQPSGCGLDASVAPDGVEDK